MKTVAIFGTFPPPVGGTSIHVYRLKKLLESKFFVKNYNTFSEKNQNDDIINVTNKKIWYLKYFFSIKEDIISCHVHNWIERAILVAIAKLRRKKIVITYHSLRKNISEENYFIKMLARFSLTLTDYNIAINEVLENELLSQGAKKVKVLPTFLLPSKIGESINKPYEINNPNRKFILCSNASNNNFHQGEDLYGIDLCIALTENLIRAGYEVTFYFFITRITNHEYYEVLNKKIENLPKDSFHLVNGCFDYSSILRQSHISYRTTNTDTYGLSVGESIHLSIPCIASNVCTRTEGARLFTSRSTEDLEQKTIEVINNYSEEVRALKKIKVKDFSEETLDFYTGDL